MLRCVECDSFLYTNNERDSKMCNRCLQRQIDNENNRRSFEECHSSRLLKGRK